MLKKLGNIKNVTKISKASQSKIQGGNFGFGGSCFSHTSSQGCSSQRGCQWYGCYCGPNYPHIAPCG
ncbi:hypothetical protein [Aquimarina sp. 2201CG5-10]|uniref:hypothetical protein n=1 Tax=Aquimarina callyspongiae TaxID=3098150 RepID=UPI002AB473F8|nr:hypothetical protein [Aquimarina sp. 2201CG5-10]MDY8136811.1 hypothetical protein [Aquimarina sp. 2201CG5-10]